MIPLTLIPALMALVVLIPLGGSPSADKCKELEQRLMHTVAQSETSGTYEVDLSEAAAFLDATDEATKCGFLD